MKFTPFLAVLLFFGEMLSIGDSVDTVGISLNDKEAEKLYCLAPSNGEVKEGNLFSIERLKEEQSDTGCCNFPHFSYEKKEKLFFKDTSLCLSGIQKGLPKLNITIGPEPSCQEIEISGGYIKHKTDPVTFCLNFVLSNFQLIHFTPCESIKSKKLDAKKVDCEGKDKEPSKSSPTVGTRTTSARTTSARTTSVRKTGTRTARTLPSGTLTTHTVSNHLTSLPTDRTTHYPTGITPTQHLTVFSVGSANDFGYRLTEHVIDSKTANDVVDCHSFCASNNNCASFNFNPRWKICEINQRPSKGPERYMKQDRNFIHYTLVH